PSAGSWGIVGSRRPSAADDTDGAYSRGQGRYFVQLGGTWGGRRCCGAAQQAAPALVVTARPEPRTRTTIFAPFEKSIALFTRSGRLDFRSDKSSAQQHCDHGNRSSRSGDSRQLIRNAP